MLYSHCTEMTEMKKTLLHNNAPLRLFRRTHCAYFANIQRPTCLSLRERSELPPVL
ncbi:hypothetical protein BDW60DRAFT_182406, partial [Aspergillus nidulans var. acristatus]